MGTPKDLRCGSHDIARVERVIEFPSGNQSARVSDVGHKESAMLIRRCSKLSVIPIPRVSRSTTNDQFWFEETGLGGQRIIVDQVRFTMYTIWEGLEVDGRGRHLLFGGLHSIWKRCIFSRMTVRWDIKYQTNVVSVGEVSTVWKSKSHETVLGLDQRCQGCKATPRP